MCLTRSLSRTLHGVEGKQTVAAPSEPLRKARPHLRRRSKAWSILSVVGGGACAAVGAGLIWGTGGALIAIGVVLVLIGVFLGVGE